MGEPHSDSYQAMHDGIRDLRGGCPCCHDPSDVPPPPGLPAEMARASTKPATAGPDMVKAPPHYTKYKPELLDFIEQRMLQGRVYTPHEHAALKYIDRWRDKNGAEDLRKAANYLLRLADLVERGL